jgi:hypothetical protein
MKSHGLAAEGDEELGRMSWTGYSGAERNTLEKKAQMAT